MACFFQANWAELKSCSEEKAPNKMCFTGKNGYVKSRPSHVSTILELKEIVDINENENSINIQAMLISNWTDSSLKRSKGSNL